MVTIFTILTNFHNFTNSQFQPNFPSRTKVPTKIRTKFVLQMFIAHQMSLRVHMSHGWNCYITDLVFEAQYILFKISQQRDMQGNYLRIYVQHLGWHLFMCLFRWPLQTDEKSQYLQECILYSFLCLILMCFFRSARSPNGLPHSSHC